MRFHFLGGASEVGASCTVLEVAGKRLLIDAGVRMRTQRAGSALPELDRLQELGAPDAILVTHAHTDHIGALPLVYLGYPQVPIYTTAPSQALTKVLLQDSLRIMESIRVRSSRRTPRSRNSPSNFANSPRAASRRRSIASPRVRWNSPTGRSSG